MTRFLLAAVAAFGLTFTGCTDDSAYENEGLIEEEQGLIDEGLGEEEGLGLEEESELESEVEEVD